MNFSKTMIVDVFHAYGYDLTTGELIFVSKNLTKGGIKNTLSSEEVRNGRGNSLFTMLYSDKGADVTLTENTFNFAEIAMLAGTTIKTGAGVGYSQEQKLVVGTDLSITLPTAPKTGAKVTCYKDGKEVTGTLADSKITFTTGVAKDDEVIVYPYLIETPATCETIHINMDEEPKAIKLVLKTKEISAGKKVIADIEIICQAIPTGEWQIDTTSKVQANEQEITLKVLKPENEEDLYKINRIPRAQ